MKKFDNDWWDNYLSQTNNLTQTRVFRNSLTAEETALMRKYVVEIIDQLAQYRTDRHGYRVFVEGKKIDSEGMEKIYDSPPCKYKSLTNWIKNTFKDQKFGIIINEGERFNLALSKMIAVKTAPLLKKIGFPQEGINFSLFIGNYGWTPLGIHQDSPGESVLHFHLGPGAKTMYTWKKEVFDKLVDTKNFNRHDIKPLLPHADTFEFKEGDLFYMPTGAWHIGYSGELSLAVTFWTYNHTKYRFAQRLHRTICDQFLKKNDELVIPDKNNLQDSSASENILSCFEFEDDLNTLSYTKLFQEMYTDLRYSIASNAGYRTSPFPKEEGFNLSEGEVVQLEEPFTIRCRKSLNGEKIYLYVRGHKFSLNYFDGIKKMMDEINKGAKMEVNKLLSILDESWSAEVGISILELLYKHHGIRASKRSIL